MVVDLPDPVDPRTAECRVTNSFSAILAAILSALDSVPIVTCPCPLTSYILRRCSSTAK